MLKKKILGAMLVGILSCTAVGFAEGTRCNGYPHAHRSQIYQYENCLQGDGEIYRGGDRKQMEVKNTLETKGEIVAIGEDGLVTVKGEGDYEIISLRIAKASKHVDNCGGGKATQIYDTNGKKLSAKKLKVGMKVDCYYEARVTRSYPGQANAKAIIVKNEESEYRTTLLKVSKVEQFDDKNYVTIEASNNELIASIDKKAYKDYNQIVEDDEVLVWYGIMTMSLPPRTGAAKAIVL